MTRTISSHGLPVAALAAAVTHAAKKDVRFYLNGVYIDFPAGRIVATDGHRLFVGAIPAADCAPVIVDRNTAADAVKAARKSTCPLMCVAVSENPNGGTLRRVELTVDGAGFTAAEIDGQFPQYERLVPRTPSGADAQYNPQYLLDAADALALYVGQKPGAAYPHVARNGDSGALITRSGITALCVVMPALSDGGDSDLAWLDAAPALAVAA